CSRSWPSSAMVRITRGGSYTPSLRRKQEQPRTAGTGEEGRSAERRQHPSRLRPEELPRRLPCRRAEPGQRRLPGRVDLDNFLDGGVDALLAVALDQRREPLSGLGYGEGLVTDHANQIG